MKESIIISALLSATLLFASGCSTSGCTDNQSSIPYAGFYSSATGQEISLSGLEIGGVDAPNDSLLYDGKQKTSAVYLPLRSTAERTSFYFHYNQGGLDSEELNDTLTFSYNSKPYFASEECGAVVTYRIKSLTYTRHLIESIELTDSLISNTDIERIKIFFRTQQ